MESLNVLTITDTEKNSWYLSTGKRKMAAQRQLGFYGKIRSQSPRVQLHSLAKMQNGAYLSKMNICGSWEKFIWNNLSITTGLRSWHLKTIRGQNRCLLASIRYSTRYLVFICSPIEHITHWWDNGCRKIHWDRTWSSACLTRIATTTLFQILTLRDCNHCRLRNAILLWIKRGEEVLSSGISSVSLRRQTV